MFILSVWRWREPMAHIWGIGCLIAGVMLAGGWWVHRRITDNIFLAARQRLCENCGYDLRGNRAATTCPECGAPIKIRRAKRPSFKVIPRR
jgi:hypothetical protein